MTENQKIIESLFFVSTVPLVQKDIIKVFGKENAPDLEKEVSNLNNLYKQSSFYIKPIGDGFMMVSKKDFEPFISKSQADSPSFNKSFHLHKTEPVEYKTLPYLTNLYLVFLFNFSN